MKSMTLTQQLRNEIMVSILNKWKEMNPAPDFAVASHELGIHFWKEKYKDYLNQFDKLPNKFYNTTKVIKYCVDGQVDQVILEHAVPVDWEIRSYNVPVLASVRSNDEVYKKFSEVDKAHKKWLEDQREIERESKAIINSVSTTKQLIDLWPQCEPFLPAHIANPNKAIRLPAIQISRLNERIGLIESEKTDVD